MSRIHIAYENGKADLLRVMDGDTEILIDSLVIRPRSNSRTPFAIYGIGGASIALTPEKTLNVVSEYLRMAMPEGMAAEYRSNDTKMTVSINIHDRT
jgi:hypothetical protein